MLREVHEEKKRDRQALEADRARHEAEQEQVRVALEAREQALQVRLGEVDAQAARHARRKIREDLKTVLAERSETFKLTSGTQDLRLPIALVALLAIIVFGAAFFLNLWYAIGHDQSGWTPTIRQVALGAALASTLVFYLRWQNRWFEQHAQEEFRLKRMALDVDRASWVVELAMEWKDDEGGELPAELLSRLTANLFDQPKHGDEPLHPADQLASALFGSASEVALDIPGRGSMKIDRKGIKNLQQAKEDNA
jgi:hypothetical protein